MSSKKALPTFKAPSVKKTFLYLFVISIVWLVFDALISSKTQAFPCAMDYAERTVMCLFGVLCLIAFLQPLQYAGKKIYSMACFFLSCLGIYVAGYHWWIQNLQPEQLYFYTNVSSTQLQNMTFLQILSLGLQGERSCATVYWVGGGLTIEGWTLLVFFVFALSSLFQFLRKELL